MLITHALKRFFSALACVTLCVGCGSPHFARARAVSRPLASTPGRLRVGTARIDVTPPPGGSTFGHGPDARVTNGYWSRLYCRAFVIETSPADRIAIVPCDLAAISVLLQRDVATHVADVVPPSQLIITATHTHAGPAHYFESAAYGGAISTRLPGFDPEMLEFLSRRISAGILTASTNMRFARARWAHTNHFCLTRNRSLFAHQADPEVLRTQVPDDLPCAPLSAEQRAIDPALNVLQFEATDSTGAQLAGPLGWIVFFAMHPTVLPNTNRLLGADAFGVTSRTLEAELRRAWRGCTAQGDSGCQRPGDPLAAIVNTNEGDVVPVWSVGNVEETQRVGRDLARAAFATYDPNAAFRYDPFLASRYLEVDLPGAETVTGMALCDRGELGQGSSHGGTDHPTSIDAILPGPDDIDSGRTDCQRPKRRLLGGLQPILIGSAPTRFPEHVSFSLVRIDDTYISFVPGEMTINAGARVNRAVRDVVDPLGSGATALVGGLANGYIQYIASAPEYELQRYEGGSTLYGPNTADYFADRMRVLARSMVSRGEEPRSKGSYPIGELAAVPYELAPIRHRFAPLRGTPLSDVSARSAAATCRVPNATTRTYCFMWKDGAPDAVPITERPWIELVGGSGEAVHACDALEPLGSGQACDPGAKIDDEGLDFRTRIHHRSGDAWFWSTMFTPSAVEAPELDKGDMRIRVRGSGAVPALKSARLDADVPPCSRDALRYCLE